MQLFTILGLLPVLNIFRAIVNATQTLRPVIRHTLREMPNVKHEGPATITIHNKRNDGVDFPSTSRWPFSPLELGLPTGWVAYPFQETQAILPMRLAASALEELYYTVFEEAAAGFWGPDLYSSDSSFDVTLGVLQLSFTLVFGQPPIPWQVVAAFAFNMFGATQRGYTSGFTGWIRSPGGSIYRITLGIRAGLARQAR